VYKPGATKAHIWYSTTGKANKKAAIKSYQLSTQKFTDKANNEAFKALEELEAKK
jgi:hypothetical protein